MSDIVRPTDNWSEKEIFKWMRDVASRFHGGSFVWNPPPIGGLTTSDSLGLAAPAFPIFALLVPGMVVMVSPPSGMPIGTGVAFARVFSEGVLSIRLFNLSGFASNPPSGTWTFLAYSP